MRAVVNKYYFAAHDALPESQRRPFQKQLLALSARAFRLRDGEDEGMDGEMLANLDDDLGRLMKIPDSELRILLDEVFEESIDPLKVLLDGVRSEQWPTKAKEALYACPFWATLLLTDSDFMEDEERDRLLEEVKGFLKSLGKALGYDPTERKHIESDCRALFKQRNPAEDDDE
jgi:hypothetical protein